MNFFMSDLPLGKKRVSFAAVFWFMLAIIAAVIQVSKKDGLGINNYLIFKGVFWHAFHSMDLFAAYPAEYGDINHYGPFFSIIIAPFALLPDKLGCFLWCMANAAFLYYAVRRLPVSYLNKNIILLIGAVEMMTSIHNVQFNPMITAWILFAYILVYEEKDFWATLFIAAGILTKLYGIVGLAFFFFSGRKSIFILSLAFWLGAFFCLPMLFSSASFIIRSYKDWYHALSDKNQLNADSPMQGMTVMRIIKKFLRVNIADLYVLSAAAFFYLLPLLRFRQLREINFQLSYLAMLLIGTVIFSSSAESATFVIAMTGVGIWYITQEKKTWVHLVLGFAILFTSLSTTDLFPGHIKSEYVRPYALKALPCLIIWIILAFNLITKNFALRPAVRNDNRQRAIGNKQPPNT